MASAGTADVALEELQTRLLTFTQQLESIHELLESDPQNEEFLGIARDLVEVIRLTKEMIDLKLNGSEEQPQRAKAAPAAVQQRQQQTVDPELELSFSPGTICEAQSKGVWYPAYIESVTSNNTYNVHYLGFGNKDELSESSLRGVPPVPQIPLAGAMPPKHAIAVGFKSEAKYYVDSQFYTCTVTQITDHGFQVLFDGYGNSEEVPYEYMRALAPTAGATTTTAAAAASGVGLGTQKDSATGSKAPAKPFVAVIEKPIKVPENLQILPTDSEAEKERKRKRLRAIKSLNRHKTIDNERNLKQNDWKSFQHKAQKKQVKGVSGVLSKRGTSIFASPETVGGKVGVVGSGQGMTTFQDGRKKVKLSGVPGTGGGLQ
ncbi:hypothetical protein Gpo141_00006147 [Globisporangium polare]